MKSFDSDNDLRTALSGLPRAEAPAFLYTRVRAKLQSEAERLQKVPPARLALATAAAVAVLLLNVFVWQKLSHHSAGPTGGSILGNSALNLYSSDT
jgi:hypothetical protein